MKCLSLHSKLFRLTLRRRTTTISLNITNCSVDHLSEQLLKKPRATSYIYFRNVVINLVGSHQCWKHNYLAFQHCFPPPAWRITPTNFMLILVVMRKHVLFTSFRLMLDLHLMLVPSGRCENRLLLSDYFQKVCVKIRCVREKEPFLPLFWALFVDLVCFLRLFFALLHLHWSHSTLHTMHSPYSTLLIILTATLVRVCFIFYFVNKPSVKFANRECPFLCCSLLYPRVVTNLCLSVFDFVRASIFWIWLKQICLIFSICEKKSLEYCDVTLHVTGHACEGFVWSVCSVLSPLWSSLTGKLTLQYCFF